MEGIESSGEEDKDTPAIKVKGFTFNTASQKCTLYKSIRGERKNTSSVSGKKS